MGPRDQVTPTGATLGAWLVPAGVRDTGCIGDLVMVGAAPWEQLRMEPLVVLGRCCEDVLDVRLGVQKGP